MASLRLSFWGRLAATCVRIPVSIKLSPYHSSTGHFARQLLAAGADGLALFNRVYEPDVDLDTLQPRLDVDLSTRADMRLGLIWLSLLHGHQGQASLAATSGVSSGEDVVKYLLAGADVVMTTAALVRHGSGYAGQLVDGVQSWLSRRQLDLSRARGLLAVPSNADATQYARSGYISGLERAKKIYAR